jgi:hypothetical protein
VFLLPNIHDIIKVCLHGKYIIGRFIFKVFYQCTDHTIVLLILIYHIFNIFWSWSYIIIMSLPPKNYEYFTSWLNLWDSNIFFALLFRRSLSLLVKPIAFLKDSMRNFHWHIMPIILVLTLCNKNTKLPFYKTEQ